MELRILSYNIHKGIGWTTRKSTLLTIKNHLFAQDPDFIFLQEIYVSQMAELANDTTLHTCYGKNKTVKRKGDYGNAIISKYPLEYVNNINLSMHRLEHRGMLHCIVKDKQFITPTHLLCAHLGLFKNDRTKQIIKIIQYIKKNIPENETIILGGDFNDWTNFSAGMLTKELNLQEVFLTTHGKYARTFPAWAPVFALDRIYTRGFKIGKAHRLIKKPWRLLSDHIAIEATLELP